MTKKQYTIIGITILIFIILIAFILIKGNKSSWTKEILNSNSYTITKIDCDNNKTKLDNNIMKKIDSTWNIFFLFLENNEVFLFFSKIISIIGFTSAV